MNPDKQRIAIAEACGLSTKQEQLGGVLIYRDKRGYPVPALPDYLNDLNAMHEAEKTLTEDQWDDYINWHLRCTVAEDQDRSIKCSARPMPGEVRGLVHATAAQRAKAFLLATDQWEDEP